MSCVIVEADEADQRPPKLEVNQRLEHTIEEQEKKAEQYDDSRSDRSNAPPVETRLLKAP